MIRAILTDIEGTTTSIAFVHDVLFPYSREHLPQFIRDNQDDFEVLKALDMAGAEAGQPNLTPEESINLLLQWIAEDRKTTPLKTLQGLLWRKGYQEGAYKGHLYPDAFENLQKWHQQGIALYVFSSGSVNAQKLLFSHTEYGDLTPLFKGYFDTSTGPKKKKNSYTLIAKAMSQKTEDILFLSDITAELDAAAAAGMQTCRLVREGSADIDPECLHPQVRSFADMGLNPHSEIQTFNDPSVLNETEE